MTLISGIIYTTISDLVPKRVWDKVTLILTVTVVFKNEQFNLLIKVGNYTKWMETLITVSLIKNDSENESINSEGKVHLYKERDTCKGLRTHLNKKVGVIFKQTQDPR